MSFNQNGKSRYRIYVPAFVQATASKFVINVSWEGWAGVVTRTGVVTRPGVVNRASIVIRTGVVTRAGVVTSASAMIGPVK